MVKTIHDIHNDCWDITYSVLSTKVWGKTSRLETNDPDHQVKLLVQGVFEESNARKIGFTEV